MRKHYKRSPSATSRWLACPGSVKLCAGKASVSSAYADEGTKAHAVAEAMLRGEDVGDVDKEVIDAVKVYVDEIRAHQAAYEVIVEHTERTLSCLSIAELGGTSDHFMLYFDGDKVVLHIFDYKHGQGIPVPAEENKQLLSYCVIIESHYPGDIDLFRMTIVQPRAFNHDAVDTWECDVDRVRQHEAAIRASFNDDTLQAGEHCRFCAAKLSCPCLEKATLDAAQAEFSQIENDVEKLLELHRLTPAIKALLDAVPAALLSEFKAGRPVPGHKVVERKSHRRWVLEEPELLQTLGVDRERATRKVLLTPPQLEKEFPDKKKEIGKLCTSDVIGYSVVPESHRGKAVDVSAISEFTEIENDGDND